MPRLFVGIPLPPEYREAIEPFTRSLRVGNAKVAWSRERNWHMTLKFLGDTDEDRIPAIRQALASIHCPAFTMQAGGHGAFPDLRRPRVLWLGLAQGSKQTATLAALVEGALEEVGIERDRKPFRPHLTLGRIRKPGRTDWDAALKAGKREWPPFTVDRFILWRSVLKPTGAEHIPLAEVVLG